MFLASENIIKILFPKTSSMRFPLPTFQCVYIIQL